MALQPWILDKNLEFKRETHKTLKYEVFCDKIECLIKFVLCSKIINEDETNDESFAR